MNLRVRLRQVASGAAIAATAAIGATGCGSTSSTGGAASASSTSSPTTVTAPTKPVTITLLESGSPTELGLNALKIKTFEKLYPNIHIRRQVVPYSQAQAEVRAVIAGKTNVNITDALFPGTYAASFSRGLVPLDRYLTPQERQTWGLLRSSLSPDGHVYSIADSSYAYAYAYNKKLFARLGASPPKTWSEFLSLCDRFNAAGIVPIAAGWKDGFYAEGFMYQFADMLLTHDQAQQFARLQLPITSSAFRTALEDLVVMKQHHCFSQAAPGMVYYDDLRNQFAAGRAAMVLEPTGGGPVELGGLYPKQLGQATIGVFPPPPIPGSHYAQFVDYGPNAGWSVTNWSSPEQVAAAWLFIKWDMTAAAQEQQWKANGTFPAVRDVNLTTTYAPTANVFQYIKWPDNYTVYTSYPATASAIFEKQAVAMMTGSITPSALLSQMQQAIDQAKPGLLPR